MLTGQSESRQFSASSVVDNKTVMFMGASYNGENINFSKNIVDIDAYIAHREEVDADYDDFQNNVIAEVEK